MTEHTDEPYADELTQHETIKFERFCDNIENKTRPIQQTIATMANKSHLVESATCVKQALARQR
jgi:hypothetical protein